MASKAPHDFSSSYPTSLISNNFYFHFEGFYQCVNLLSALSLGIYCLLCLEYTVLLLPVYVNKHTFSYKLQKFIFKQALGKEEFIGSTLQYLTWRAVVIQALGTTGTSNLNAAWTPFLSLSLMSIPLWCELHFLLLQLPSSTCRSKKSCGNALSLPPVFGSHPANSKVYSTG